VTQSVVFETKSLFSRPLLFHRLDISSMALRAEGAGWREEGGGGWKVEGGGWRVEGGEYKANGTE
jgi:hypothetical protein